MSQSLLATRRFAPLFWCQFFSTFNDNLLKNALVLLILFKIGGATGEALVTLAGGISSRHFFCCRPQAANSQIASTRPW